MKKIFFSGIVSLLLSTPALAVPPVTLSGPNPALAVSYTPNTSSSATYNITNYVPQKTFFSGIASLLLSTPTLAMPPVTLSGPNPTLAVSYASNTSSSVTYTITNYVPQSFPITVSGLSNPIQRTSVANDCGSSLPAGPSTCDIGITISPTSAEAGATINQTLAINYQGRTTLTSPISFSVSAFAYVTPLSPDAFNAAQIQQYLLSQDGLLSFDENATQTEGHYGQMTFATVDGTQYAYILENGVTYCSINSDSTFNHCIPTTAPTTGMNHPHGIAFATFNQQYAYLTDPNSSSLFQCTIDTTSGDLSSCSEYSDGNIDAALGIAFNTDGNGAQHAYVADAATGMLVCPMNATTGSFMSSPGCTTTPSLGAAPSWVPYGIAFTTARGTRYAYVADNGTGANFGHVYRCLLNADGTFKNNSCVATPTDTSSFAPWNPSYIAFTTFNGIQYAYVVNNQSVNIGSIYRCTVDETTGLLTQDCIKTPDIDPSRDAWQPSGIAFR